MPTHSSTEDRAGASSATPIVGLGASAGGLEVLGQFLANVPAASGLAYIDVQHLDPTHKAMLAELLQRSTVTPLTASSVGFLPSNLNLSISVLGRNRPATRTH